MEKLENERNEAASMKTSLSDEDINLKNSLNYPNNNNEGNNSNLNSESNNGIRISNNGDNKSNNNGNLYDNNGDSTRRPSKGPFIPTDTNRNDINKKQTLQKLKLKKEERERKLREKELEQEKRRKFQRRKSRTTINNEDGDDDDENDNEEIIKESRISKMVTESLTKKVIVLILALLLIFPLLSDDFYEDDSRITYNLISEFYSTNYAIFSDANNIQNYLINLHDSKFPVVNITVYGVRQYYDEKLINFKFRYKELKTVYSQDAQVRIVYSIRKETKLQGLLNFFQTIFVCICITLASLTFEKDADDLVLDPLEIMIEIVEKVEKDPIGAKNIEELQEGVKAQVQQLEDEEENEGKNKNKNNANNNTDNFEV